MQLSVDVWLSVSCSCSTCTTAAQASCPWHPSEPGMVHLQLYAAVRLVVSSNGSADVGSLLTEADTGLTAKLAVPDPVKAGKSFTAKLTGLGRKSATSTPDSSVAPRPSISQRCTAPCHVIQTLGSALLSTPFIRHQSLARALSAHTLHGLLQGPKHCKCCQMRSCRPKRLWHLSQPSAVCTALLYHITRCTPCRLSLP